MGEGTETGSTSRILKSVSKESRGLVQRLQKLQDIAIALSAEQDQDKLLSMILKESRALTDADSGSMFIRTDEVETDPNATAKDKIHKVTPYLHLKVAQNDSIHFPFKEMRLPFDRKTIAGHVATSGVIVNLPDVYNIPKTAPFTYSTAFDEISGYRCKSMLVIPMKNRDGEIIGVIQLINKKKDPAIRLENKDKVERNVTMFDPFDEEFALSLASQAAVCVEKAKLYEEIERMFEGLVNSFTLALERRNRTTYGHCMRVAKYALAIAEAVNHSPELFGGIKYSAVQLKELRYAALLHDIGKIAVPEAVLDKKNKLLDSEITTIEYRLHYWRSQGGPADKAAAYAAHIKKITVPKPMNDEDVRLLGEIRAAKFVDVDGQEKPLLNDYEFENLSIQRGNLTKAERKMVEQHIVDTWEILKRIPWPRDFRTVANIAACHHEKVNGSGYPWGLKGDQIPMGGKILAIVDIYEALTAKDRPYKPAIPMEKALAILDDECAKGNIDAKLYQLFKDRKIYMTFIDETGFVKPPSVPQIPK